MNEKLTKKYQCWTRGDTGYNLHEFDTIEECFDLARSYSSSCFYITKKVDVIIKELSE